MEAALTSLSTGRLAEAEGILRQIVTAQPDHADALHLLGVTAYQAGRYEVAVDLIGRATAVNPQVAAYHYHLGLALKDQDKKEDSAAAFRTALRLEPTYVEALNNLGILLKDQGRLEEAIALFGAALQIKPDCPEVLNSLGLALKEQGKLNAAIGAHRAALRLKPDFAEARYNLGNAFFEQGNPEAAAGEYRAAIATRPHFAEALHDLGSALMELGQIDDALSTYRHLLAFNPQDARTHSSLIYSLHFRPGGDARSIREEQLQWNYQHAAPLRPLCFPHSNDPDPNRRLRVGYVSPDFHDHASAFFIVPLLEAHDKAQVELLCYSSVRQPDAVSQRLRHCVGVWRDVANKSDAEIAEWIRADGIDILIDLSMHTGRNRLLVFARKPAPVQVSWLAYPGSTGVDTIDYRLTDAWMEPIDAVERLPGEHPFRMPDSWCCYDPLEAFPEVSDLPCKEAGYVTFGSLNKFSRINENVLCTWAALLRTVPGSRLVMLCPEGQCRERVLLHFEALGVSWDRVHPATRCAWAEYLDYYRRIDIALDPFPCNGMTTTCHSLWMGVPIITLAGAESISRAGLSLLSAIGLAELAAASEADYVRIAAELAGNLPRLAELRSTMRNRMQDSPLMDAPRFARNVEGAYREMWRRWCERNAP